MAKKKALDDDDVESAVTGFVAAVGRVLRTERRRRDLTKDQAVEISGLGRTTIYRIEHGDTAVGWKKILELATAYEVAEDALLLAAYREHFSDKPTPLGEGKP